MKEQIRKLEALSDEVYTEINRLNALLRTISSLSVFENNLGTEVEDAHRLIQMAESACGGVADQVHALDREISSLREDASTSEPTNSLPGYRLLSLLKHVVEGEFDEEWAEAFTASIAFILQQAPKDEGFFEVAEYLKEVMHSHGYGVAIVTDSANGGEEEFPLPRAAALAKAKRQTEQNA